MKAGTEKTKTKQERSTTITRNTKSQNNKKHDHSRQAHKLRDQREQRETARTQKKCNARRPRNAQQIACQSNIFFVRSPCVCSHISQLLLLRCSHCCTSYTFLAFRASRTFRTVHSFRVVVSCSRLWSFARF